MRQFDGKCWLVYFSVCIAGFSLSAQEPDQGSSALAVFEQRIMPIFQSDDPSSCVQCHLSAVDLKDYILPSHEQTFASLREQGLIDVERPEKSKILKLISMGNDDPDALSKRIHAKMRNAEYEAFSAWIMACCQDPSLRELPTLAASATAKPDVPNEVIRFTRKDRVLDSFVRNVWSQRMRCFPCHTPHELDPSNPQHATPIERHAEFEKQYGQKINIFRETPEATLRSLINSSRKTSHGEWPLINVERPAKSLLLLKPTAKLPPKDGQGGFEPPSSADPVSHMGGLKMFVNDQSYKAIVAWIEDYSNVVGNRYREIDDLPEDNWIPTEHVLRMTNAPEAWQALRGVQMFIYAWDGQNSAWQEQPVAFTQGLVTPRHMVNGAVARLSSGGALPTDVESSELEPAKLQPGKYLVKCYYDADATLDQHPEVLLSDKDFCGQIEIEAQWKTGFKDAQVFDARQLVSQ